MKLRRGFKLFWLVAVIVACVTLLLPSAAPAKVCAWGEQKLTVVSAPEHGGTVTTQSDKPCIAGTYPNGTVVVLTAIPSAGYQFEKWSGDIDANAADNASISIVMDRARTITADFVAPGGLHTITVNASPSLGGSATIETPFESFTTSANQTSVSVQCAAGATVNITAEAAEGYHFAGWKGGVTGSQDNVSFVVNSSETITAEFSEPSSFLWCWVVVGIVVFLLIGLLIYRFKSGRVKKPEELQPQPNVEQGIFTAGEEEKAAEVAEK